MPCFTCPAGEEDKESWKQYDACELMRQYKGPHLPLLVDTGSADSFLQVRAACGTGQQRGVCGVLRTAVLLLSTQRSVLGWLTSG